MRRRFLGLALPVVAVLLWGTATAGAAGKLQVYEATVDEETYAGLVADGYDIASSEAVLQGIHVDLVLSANERAKLVAQGVPIRVQRDEFGRTTTQRAALQSAYGFNVWRSWDEPGGLRDELYEIAKENPQLVKLEVLGKSRQGREYIALKVTQGARGIKDGKRPAVLYASTYHAREWVAPEVNRRLLHWYLDQWKANNKEIKDLLKTTELWFILVHNTDGYQYTFDVERLWRKNLRDNDGNGVIDSNDGVDPNRNHPEHWGFDEEGSSSQFSSETYRGPEPASEPETRIIQRLMTRVDFSFAISYHSYGPLLLYTQGWQVQTPSADDPIYVALSGTDDDPAIPGTDPGVGGDLYITNGEFTDWAHSTRGTLAWTPELNEGCVGCGFVFPDDEALVQQEFEDNLQFALNVARSAKDPDDPASHTGLDTQAFYLDLSTIDPWKAEQPCLRPRGRRLVRRKLAGRRGAGEAEARRRRAALLDQRRSRAKGRREGFPRRRALRRQQRRPTSTTTTSAAPSGGSRSATRSSTGSSARRSARRSQATTRPSRSSRTTRERTSSSSPPRTAPAPRPSCRTRARTRRSPTTSPRTRTP